MSEPQVVSYVLLPVPLYEVEGHESCEVAPKECSFYVDTDGGGGEHCGLTHSRLDRAQAPSGHWYTPCPPDCPLRAPGVLTLADLWVLAAGRPKVDWIEHRDRTAEWGECPACGARSGCGSDEHDIYDEAVGPTCPTLRAQREYDDAAARRDALLEKYR